MRFYQPIFTKDVELFLNRRVSLIGKVLEVSEKEKYIDLIIADAFGKLIVRSFKKEKVSPFSTILVLGKCNEFSGRIYVIADLIIPLSVEEELFWRKAHLDKYKTLLKKANLEPKREVVKDSNALKIKEPEVKTQKDLRSRVLHAIEVLDKGSGVSVEEISKYLGENPSKVQKVVEELLALGEIYEASLGKLKILK